MSIAAPASECAHTLPGSIPISRVASIEGDAPAITDSPRRPGDGQFPGGRWDSHNPVVPIVEEHTARAPLALKPFCATISREPGVDVDGVVVIEIGEYGGERPAHLYAGERIGTGRPPAVDIAVKPIEGTDLLAQGCCNSWLLVERGPLSAGRRTDHPLRDYADEIGYREVHPSGASTRPADAIQSDQLYLPLVRFTRIILAS